MTLTERDNLIIDAAIEFGVDQSYEVKRGTLGITLYITSPSKAEARRMRILAPDFWKGLYVIVLSNSLPDFAEEILYDPKLS